LGISGPARCHLNPSSSLAREPTLTQEPSIFVAASNFSTTSLA
jgi:hypothetical protein